MLLAKTMYSLRADVNLREWTLLVAINPEHPSRVHNRYDYLTNCCSCGLFRHPMAQRYRATQEDPAILRIQVGLSGNKYT